MCVYPIFMLHHIVIDQLLSMKDTEKFCDISLASELSERENIMSNKWKLGIYYIYLYMWYVRPHE